MIKAKIPRSSVVRILVDMTRYRPEQDYIEGSSGERTPISHSTLHVNKFIYDDSVRFEDLQKLSSDLASELAELKQIATDADDLVNRLKKLNYRQLISVRESLGTILRDKDQEPRTPLWIVTDESDDIACYPLDQYHQASDKMAALIQAEARRNPGTPMQFHLEKRLVRDSEVSSYMEINTD